MKILLALFALLTIPLMGATQTIHADNGEEEIIAYYVYEGLFDDLEDFTDYIFDNFRDWAHYNDDHDIMWDFERSDDHVIKWVIGQSGIEEPLDYSGHIEVDLDENEFEITEIDDFSISWGSDYTDDYVTLQVYETEWLYYEGFSEGYDTGHDSGYDDGLSDGYDDGYDSGYDDAKDIYDDYQEGYDDGYDDAYEAMEAEEAIFDTVGSALSAMFGFLLYVGTEIELFGINLLTVFMAGGAIIIGYTVIRWIF